MSTELDGKPWRKAISPERDRRQSQVLAWAVGVGVACLTFQTGVFASGLITRFPAFVFGTIGISIIFAVIAFTLRAATPGGAVFGAMVCLLLVFWTGSFVDSVLRSGLAPLLLLFVLTFVATRMGGQRKSKAGLAEERRGRNAAQVIANLGVAGMSSSWVGAGVLLWAMRREDHSYNLPLHLVGTVALAALAEATADTVSSEIGQAFGGRPVMLTTLRRVEPGTDGAVSTMGTVAGVTSGALIAFAGCWAVRLSVKEAAIAWSAGVGGVLFDSLLGATVERRGWVGNDLVNFASTLFAAVAALELMIVLR